MSDHSNLPSWRVSSSRLTTKFSRCQRFARKRALSSARLLSHLRYGIGLLSKTYSARTCLYSARITVNTAPSRRPASEPWFLSSPLPLACICRQNCSKPRNPQKQHLPLADKFELIPGLFIPLSARPDYAGRLAVGKWARAVAQFGSPRLGRHASTV